jgi:NAD(P)-dependent dehydrogenase (short-subunit alcohol dehydrogenase family)/acyl carrier protein
MNNVEVEVRDVFAEVTRYPLDILDPNANLEEDLGIDSVKLGEVFSVLRERFHLPAELDIPRDNLVSIAAVTKNLTRFIGTNGNGRSLHSNGFTNGSGAVHNLAGSNGSTPPSANSRPVVDVLGQVKTVFAEVTRYPLEILDPEAGLEEDLGIDSVKLGEVFSVLRERFSLAQEIEVPRDNLRTIASIAQALEVHVLPPVAANSRTTVKLNGATAEHQPVQTTPITSPLPSELRSTDSTVEKLRDVFAEVTRYPKEILDPDSGLEEDLGIDSVKLGEVFSVLRQQYRIPEGLDIPREKLRSIRDVAVELASYVGEPSSASQLATLAKHTNGNGVSIHAKTVEQHRVTTIPSDAALYSYERPSGKPFAGKVAFISGSGRGLGKDIATYLAELGASVVINSFHSRTKGDQTAEEIRSRGGDALHLWGSMANPEHVNRVFEEIEGHHGHLDFFVGNASNGMLARLEDITIEHWEKAYRTNIIGLHQSALHATKLMRRRGGGKIITLSSPAAHGYVDYFGCMGTVKAAVESLTRSMAIEFAPYNIQVNCVSPGPVYGELLDKWPESTRLIRQWEGNTAANRLCEARDVSHFIAYLLSEPVKLFTGSVLVLDGGISSQGW